MTGALPFDFDNRQLLRSPAFHWFCFLAPARAHLLPVGASNTHHASQLTSVTLLPAMFGKKPLMGSGNLRIAWRPYKIIRHMLCNRVQELYDYVTITRYTEQIVS